MWETYVEPTLKAQAELRREGKAEGESLPPDDSDTGPMTLEHKIAECQAAGFMFGADPLDVARVVKQSWPVSPDAADRIRAKLQARVT